MPKEKAGILVDEQFGAAILRDAALEGYHHCVPGGEKRTAEFDFEYGDDFERTSRRSIRLSARCWSVITRKATGAERAAGGRLKRLSDYLAASGRSRFMFELLVPAEKAQLDRVNGDKQAYDLELRPGLMVEAIQQLRDRRRGTGCLEGRRAGPPRGLRAIVAAARAGGRDGSAASFSAAARTTEKCGNGSAIAAGVPGFIGFAVGRTVFWDALVAWRAKK